MPVAKTKTTAKSKPAASATARPSSKRTAKAAVKRPVAASHAEARYLNWLIYVWVALILLFLVQVIVYVT